MAYSTKEESAVRPIGRYPVPNKKDMPYDIVELMEEVERKVMDFCCKTLSVERVQSLSRSHAPREQLWSGGV